MIRKAIAIAEGNLDIDSISGLIAKRAIPLDLKMMDNLGYAYSDTTVYRVMNSRGLARLVKHQGSKNQISTFTQGGPELARLPSQPNVLVELLGTEVIRGKSDIWTLIDKTGTRWINQASKSDGKLTFFIDGIITKIFKDFGFDLDIEAMTDAQIEQEILKLSSKQQRQFEKFYLDAMEDYIDGGGYKLLQHFLDNSADFKYNEVILTKFKIVGITSIEVDSPATEAMAKKYKIKYNGVIPRKDLSTLTA